MGVSLLRGVLHAHCFWLRFIEVVKPFSNFQTVSKSPDAYLSSQKSGRHFRARIPPLLSCVNARCCQPCSDRPSPLITISLLPSSSHSLFPFFRFDFPDLHWISPLLHPDLCPVPKEPSNHCSFSRKTDERERNSNSELKVSSQHSSFHSSLFLHLYGQTCCALKRLADSLIGLLCPD